MNKNANVFCTSTKPLNIVSESLDNPSQRLVLEGTFAVLDKLNDNKRLYTKAHYTDLVNSIQPSINEGLFGEYEHPQRTIVDPMKATHKVLSVRIDESSNMVKGSIELLDNADGNRLASYVRAGGKLYISSRGAGHISESGVVTLQKLITYDIVKQPGFSEAYLSNVNESLQDNIEGMTTYYVTESVQEPKVENKDNTAVLVLESKIKELSNSMRLQDATIAEQNKRLSQISESKKPTIGLTEQQVSAMMASGFKMFSESLETWLCNDFAGGIESWIKTEVLPTVGTKGVNESYLNGAFADKLQSWMTGFIAESLDTAMTAKYAPAIQMWVSEEYSATLQTWLTNEYATGIQKWVSEEFSPVIEKWVSEEYSGTLQKWLTDEYATGIQKWVSEEYSGTVQSWLAKEVLPTTDFGKMQILNESKTVVSDMPRLLTPLWKELTSEQQNSILLSSVNESKTGEQFWLAKQSEILTLVNENRKTAKIGIIPKINPAFKALVSKSA